MERQQQRLVNWQCNCTIDDYPHLKRDERNDLFGADVFRRLRVSDRRAVRLWVPLEHFEWDQPLPIRRCERNERGGRACSDDECENPDGLHFGINKKFIVRVFHLIRVAMLMVTRFVSCGRARLYALPSLFPTLTVLVFMLSAALFFP